jgi:hypothetical protein
MRATLGTQGSKGDPPTQLLKNCKKKLRLPTGGNLSPGLVLVCTQLDSEQATRATLVRLFSQLPLNSNRGPACEHGPPLAPVPYL